MTDKSPEFPDSRKSHGGHVAGCDEPAFQLESPKRGAIPVLLSVPHAGRCYPESLLSQMREPAQSRLRLEDRFVDLLAVEVAKQTGAGLLVANAPRAMLDLNRAVDDIDWSMIEGKAPAIEARHSQANRRSRSGLGLLPRRLSGLGEIWKGPIKRSELDARVAGIHKPYHVALSRELEMIRDQWGAALLVDLHSMPPLRRSQSGQQPPHFVLGDRFGVACDNSLIDGAIGFFEVREKRASHNRPYSGGYVLDRHASPRRGVHALQLEVCRSTYLDARLENPSARLSSVAKLLAGLVLSLGERTSRLADNGYIAQAAE